MADDVTIIGSGLTGALLACYLGRAGARVTLYERRADPRALSAERGRSINLALSTRGLHALREVGLAEKVLAQAVLMRGRMIHHRDGSLTYQPYGNDDTQALNSVSRAELNRLLIEEAAKYPTIDLHFDHRCHRADLDRGAVDFTTPQGEKHVEVPGLLVGSDGAYSAVRAAMQRRERFDFHQEYLDHGYKELTIPAGPGGAFRMEKHALHIWPRGGYMMIALPNADGSFTCTLFCPYEGPNGFAALRTPADVRDYFAVRFPDAVPLLAHLEEEFFTNPIGPLVTIRCRPWHVGGRAVLVGDSAHAVVPFLGQGMNAGFEDCEVLTECLARHADRAAALADYEARRREHTDVLARLCVENFEEMRDRVSSRWFVLYKRLSLWLMALVPGYVPLYTLIEFSRVGYADAERRVRRQNRVVVGVLTGLLVLIAFIVWRAARP